MDIGMGSVSYQSKSWDTTVTLAKAAEDLGYDSVWVGEHIVLPVEIESRYPFSEDGKAHFDYTQDFPEAMVLLGFIAGVTRRVRLGTSVIPMMTRDPLSLAKQAATVDMLSDGRLELGLGSGWCHEEGAVLGHATDHPVDRMGEAIEIMRKAWSQDSFSHEGRFWQYPEVGVHPHPPQGRDLPVWIGGFSDATLRVCAEHGDGSLIPSRRLEKVEKARERLPEGKRIGAILSLDGSDDDGVRAREIRDAGVDLLVVGAGGIKDTAETALRRLERFADRVMPTL
jgi:probable F420-dependent oxidoreductase